MAKKAEVLWEAFAKCKIIRRANGDTELVLKISDFPVKKKPKPPPK